MDKYVFLGGMLGRLKITFLQYTPYLPGQFCSDLNLKLPESVCTANQSRNCYIPLQSVQPTAINRPHELDFNPANNTFVTDDF